MKAPTPPELLKLKNNLYDLLELAGLTEIKIENDKENNKATLLPTVVVLDADLGPNASSLTHFINQLKECLLKKPAVIILKGPHVKESEVTRYGEAITTQTSLLPHFPLLGFFSSGSTGRPKLILHHHQSLIQSAYHSGQMMELQQRDHLFSALPFYHVGGFLCLLRSFLFNSKLHWASSQELYQKLQEDPSLAKTSTVVGVPTQIEHLPKNVKDLLFYCGGDKVRESHWKKAITLKIQLVATYGQTESAGALLFQPGPQEKIRAYSDVTLSFEKLPQQVADNDQFLLSYKTSRLACAIASYAFTNKESLSIKLLNKDQYFQTQDIVKINPQKENEIIAFVARTDGQFQCGGEMISPLQLEIEIRELLKESDLFSFMDDLTLKVMGIPHERLGAIAVAFMAGFEESEFTKIQAYLKKHISAQNPGRLRSLAKYPVFKGIKPSLEDFKNSYVLKNWPL